MESIARKRKQTARSRDRRARKQRVERSRHSLATFLAEEDKRLGDNNDDVDEALGHGSDDASVYRNVYIDGRAPPAEAETWQKQLEKRREMQEMMESHIDMADMRGNTRGWQRVQNPRHRGILEEDQELALNEHMLERKLRAQAGALPREDGIMQAPLSTTERNTQRQREPVMFFEKEEGSDTDGYASSSDESVFREYTRTGEGAVKFSWIETIGAGMFPDMSEEIVRMLLEVPGVNYFYMNWAGYNRGAKRFRYARTLVQWKMFVEETCAFVDHEWYDASNDELTLELTFREFRRGELEEMKEARDKEPGNIIKHSVFPDYTSDFLRAHMTLRPEGSESRAICAQQEQTRKIRVQSTQAEAAKPPEFAIENELDHPAPVQALGAVQVEQEMTDYELLMQNERKLERKLNLRKMNDVYQKLERMRDEGGDAVMRLLSVYLYWC